MSKSKILHARWYAEAKPWPVANRFFLLSGEPLVSDSEDPWYSYVVAPKYERM